MTADQRAYVLERVERALLSTMSDSAPRQHRAPDCCGGRGYLEGSAGHTEPCPCIHPEPCS